MKSVGPFSLEVRDSRLKMIYKCEVKPFFCEDLEGVKQKIIAATKDHLLQDQYQHTTVTIRGSVKGQMRAFGDFNAIHGPLLGEITNISLLVGSPLKAHKCESPSCAWVDRFVKALRLEGARDQQLQGIAGILSEGHEKGFLDRDYREHLAGTITLASRETLVCYYSKSRDVKLVEMFIASGADLTVQEDEFGNTPLMWAIANANHANASVIIEKALGPEVLNISCKTGNAPIHLIVSKGYKDFDTDGNKLSCSSFDLLEKILGREGVDVNARNNKGDTALHLACLRKDSQMIALLLSKGADPKILNHAGEEPFDYLFKSYEEAGSILSEAARVFQLTPEDHQNSDRAELSINLLIGFAS